MGITLDDVAFLTSAAGERALARLVDADLREAETLRLLTALRKEYTASEAGAALEMARLRAQGVEKFGAAAGRLFFTRDALEQASHPTVRAYRAGELRRLGVSSVMDACCGIGADSLAFAQAGLPVTGVDRDAVRVALARHNAAALGLAARFIEGDVCEGLPDADCAFFDPARRDSAGKRIFAVERYEPPLATLRGWAHHLVVTKLSPGVELAQLEPYGGCVEFISVAGDLKEATLWRGAGMVGRRATLLTGEQFMHWEDGGAHAEVGDPQAWLVEPDAALLRAGLVQDAAARFGGRLLDETIAYFTTTARPESLWLRSWAVLDWMPFHVKRLRAYLRERDVGQVTVKKRGSPVTPEELIPQLKLRGAESRVLVLTRLRGAPVVLVCAAI
jgi:SAM-dependent methyltransferase